MPSLTSSFASTATRSTSVVEYGGRGVCRFGAFEDRPVLDVVAEARQVAPTPAKGTPSTSTRFSKTYPISLPATARATSEALPLLSELVGSQLGGEQPGVGVQLGQVALGRRPMMGRRLIKGQDGYGAARCCARATSASK